MKFFKSLSLAIAILSTEAAFSKVVQILHTNDLHSFFTGTRGGLGGYARLKYLADELKKEASSKGIPTLFLDGGDFGEGSSYYFSNQGVDSLRALDLLGVDITVLGNHDYILGGKELRNQIMAADLKATMLSANTRGKRWMGLKKLLPSYTSEIHYQYPLRPLGFISNPHKAGIKMAEKSQRDGVDYLIALTHLGLKQDKKLVEKSRSIDLVVGGHSHTTLTTPEFTKNLKGEMIPVVQAGAHSMSLGSLLVDIQGKGKSQIVDYKLYSITKETPEDSSMVDFVGNAYINREQYFGRQWDEVIGFSEITLSGIHNGTGNGTRTCWSRHLARLTRTAAKAELGLQFDIFQGEEISPGPITFGDMVDNFPHFRKWGDMGWNIGRARVSGFLLKKILSAMAESDVQLAVTIDGIQANELGRTTPRSFDPRRDDIHIARIKGEPIQNMRYYTIALPSEIPWAMQKMFNVFAHVLLHDLEYLDNTNYWPLIEDYLRKNSPLQCLKD
jgi:2',3'-cyclic-nucleotide 2'-phosphodiesterase (5'-nucleotidase family)